MRNRYPGMCYRCNERVEPYDGHFERCGRGWRTQHATCAIAYRGRSDSVRLPRPASIEAARKIAGENQAAEG